MRRSSIILGAVCAIALSGCAWTQAHRSQIQATAGIIAKRAAIIAGRVVLSAAVSSFDASKKQDFLEGLSTGFRSLEVGEVISGGDVEAMVNAWTPDKPHWDSLAASFRSEWDRLNPRTAAESAIFAEAFARGLQMNRGADGKLKVESGELK